MRWASRRRDPWPSWVPGARYCARRNCPAPCCPRRQQPPAGGQLPVRRGSTGDIGLLRRLADHAIARHHPGAADAERPYLALFEGGGGRPGIADRAMDADRIRPRGDEHRQRDDLRRNDRLRTVRFHGGLRPRHGLQFHRLLGALRLRQPARRRRLEPGPFRRDAASAALRRCRGGGRARGEIVRGFPARVRRRVVVRDARQARFACGGRGRRRSRR